MMQTGQAPSHLVAVLRKPSVVESYELGDWDVLVRQARWADLLATLQGIIKDAGLYEHVPREVVWHFDASANLAEAKQSAIRWETAQVYRALEEIVSQPPVLLKGTAYVFAEVPAAEGRIFQDIDILVPKNELHKVEQGLFLGGWASTYLDDYDQKYYRTWMHELPPLKHMRRGSVIDVHHTILPETARLKPDANKLSQNARTVEVRKGFSVRVLAPVDMVLHSATHLFHEGEFDHGLRDLLDLDRLMRHFSKETDFWEELVDRAVELDLVQPMYYAARYARRILHTPVPDGVADRLGAKMPGGWKTQLMDFLFLRALNCHHSSCRQSFFGIANWMLFVRSHYLRMPLNLLVPHLIRKALKRDKSREDGDGIKGIGAI